MPEVDSEIVEKIVLSFDICSSSSIIEDLMLRGRESDWAKFLRETRQFLNVKKVKYRFVPHKFTGDGWLILAPKETTGDIFFRYIDELAAAIRNRYQVSILPLLENPPEIAGITFGADAGKLIRLNNFGEPEYVGRPINIACRLMNAIKDDDINPAYKMLLSRPLYNVLSKTTTMNHGFRDTTRKLRNIKGGEEYPCVLGDVLLP